MTSTQEFIDDLTDKISMPDIYRQIRRSMDNPAVTIEAFEELTLSDSQLSSSIIRIANSEFFGFERKVETLYDAICLIGVGQLHDLLLAGLCMRTFSNIKGQSENYLKAHWRQAVKQGIAALSVARFCRMPSSNQFFTVGFLLEIGHAAMLVSAAELTFESFYESQRKQCPVHIMERTLFGFDHCQLGADLLRHWQLPEFYPQVIEYHLYPERAKPNIRKETEVAYLAHWFCGSSNTEEHRSTGLLDSQQEVTVKQTINQEIVDHADDVYALLIPSK